MIPKELRDDVSGDLTGCRCECDVNQFLVLRRQFNSIDLKEYQCGFQADPFIPVDE